ncbi:hypothetical protein GCM10011316_00020 [Roseibium aquae]|uniref:UspA domain-containing protein n=2 Tax=Roseibium aquae TaxID=1323746 RepID=A0A916WT10_9HYPH|nr:universal stress protein [Roseibium aquae]GGB31958.1 hypothetical protein GCM10011316_00020 [Roseibium aquae]
MFRKIMMPIDLAHADKLEKARTAGADLARHYGVPICYVAVAPSTPGALGHNPSEFAAKVEAFGSSEAERFGITVETKALTSHDPTVDLDNTLLKAVDDIGADVVIMASHIPNIADRLWPSNGGTIASRSKASVFVIRDN